jgi:hypothetical protein
VEQFGRPTPPEAGWPAFLDGLPDLLAARALRELAAAIVSSRARRRPVVAAMGAHVIKCGAGPFILDLMQRGYLSALALNGAGAIHDLEVALVGGTSEDVAEGLCDGSFGTARETGELCAQAARAGAAEGIGLGAALGQLILARRLPHAEMSLLAAACRRRLPATVHVAIGADFTHMHPCASGADLGVASHADFRILCGVVGELEGGVWLNLGSAVLLPEVFLKALNVARNLGHRVADFVTADFDMIRHYRAQENVLRRPGGRAYAITGHHEILLPLLRMAVLAAAAREEKEE